MNFNAMTTSLITSAILVVSFKVTGEMSDVYTKHQRHKISASESEIPKIFHIQSLSQISNRHPPETLFLFDIDDTIFDSFSMLGSKAWRRYIVEATKKIDPSKNWHDIFTHALAEKHPLKAVEETTSSLIKDLQYKKFAVCGFTSRERKSWYDMPQEGVDDLTVKQLFSVDVDFNNGSLENNYPELAKDSEYYKGIFFANIEPKGRFLFHLLKTRSTFPEKIVFIDDKLAQVESVADVLSELGISHECYFYSATDKKAEVFNPLIANIQLYYFYASNGDRALSDEQAELIALSNPELDANYYLIATLEIANPALAIK